MPELPEVETIRRGLSSLIVKQKLKSVKVLCEKSFVNDSSLREQFFEQSSQDAEISIKNTEQTELMAIRRFGKALVLDFNGGFSFLIHLRMTGQLIYDGKKDTTPIKNSMISYQIGEKARFAAGHPSENFVENLPNKQTRVILEFENGTLYFNDQRKFGFIKMLPTKDVEKDTFVQKLAKEPWQMNPTEFYEKLQRHAHAPIKSVILDQTILCGLGNIYADESLFLSRIHPGRKAGSLSLAEATTLLKNASAVMEKSIASGGSTMATYLKPDGSRGDYLDLFANVYHRDGKPCPICGATIIKLKVGGRGTHICPKCQKLADNKDAENQQSECDLTSDSPTKTTNLKGNHKHD